MPSSGHVARARLRRARQMAASDPTKGVFDMLVNGIKAKGQGKKKITSAAKPRGFTPLELQRLQSAFDSWKDKQSRTKRR